VACSIHFSCFFPLSPCSYPLTICHRTREMWRTTETSRVKGINVFRNGGNRSVWLEVCATGEQAPWVLLWSVCCILRSRFQAQQRASHHIDNPHPFLTFFLFLVGWYWVSWYCGHYWPIVPGPDDRWWWYCGEIGGMKIVQGKPKYSEETCPSATLSTTNPIWPGPLRWEDSD
jgi:hypothetical protein